MDANNNAPLQDLQCPYLSELDLTNSKSNVNLEPQLEGTSSVNINTSPQRCDQTTERPEQPLPSPTCELVDCQYKDSGCSEKLPSGSELEKDHSLNCFYRPIQCWLHHVCDQRVPYSAYLLHLYNHFIFPVFSSLLSTSVVLNRNHFDVNQRWHPRWMSCFGKDFFVMISRKLPGIWYFWVWIMGTPEEARQFAYDIEVSKANDKKIGTFPVVSCRLSEDDFEVQDHEACLSMTDYQVKKMSQIRDNLISCKRTFCVNFNFGPRPCTT